MTQEPAQTAPDDDIARAFAALRGEVSLTRAALEGLTAARERIPDYSVTLSQIAKELADAASGIERLEQSPAARLSPASLTTAIVKASVDARAEDRALLSDARDVLSCSIGRIDGIVQRGQAADRQWQRIWQAAAGGAIGGMLLMAVLPGAIARNLPASWHVPEWMAARTMGLGQKQAGERMVETASDH
jgi:Family of unknown function (DUF6118)